MRTAPGGRGTLAIQVPLTSAGGEADLWGVEGILKELVAEQQRLASPRVRFYFRR